MYGIGKKKTKWKYDNVELRQSYVWGHLVHLLARHASYV